MTNYYGRYNRAWLKETQLPSNVNRFGTRQAISERIIHKFLQTKIIPKTPHLGRLRDLTHEFHMIDQISTYPELMKVLLRFHQSDIACLFTWTETGEIEPCTAMRSWLFKLPAIKNIHDIETVRQLFQEIRHMKSPPSSKKKKKIKNKKRTEPKEKPFDAPQYETFHFPNYHPPTKLIVEEKHKKYFIKLKVWLQKAKQYERLKPMLKFCLAAALAPTIFTQDWWMESYGRHGAKPLTYRRVVFDAVLNQIPEWISHQIFEEHQAPEHTLLKQVVRQVRQVFLEQITAITWLEPKNKTKIQSRVANCQVFLGHVFPQRQVEIEIPPQGKALKIPFSIQILRAREKYKLLSVQFPRRSGIPKDFQPVANYNPITNVIHIGSGFFHPPFFLPGVASASAAQITKIYAGVGRVIAHEFGHILFPHTYPKSITLSPEEKRRAQQITTKINKAFLLFMENASSTQDENFADVVGVCISYLVAKHKTGKLSKEMFDTYSRYFAEDRREKMRPSYKTWWTKTSDHAFSDVRVNASLTYLAQKITENHVENFVFS